MEIHGLVKTTLLDYPQHVAATVFTGGCNFRCPFCHNKDLVLHPNSVPLIHEDELFSFLKKRHGVLDGVCITGGEPSLQPDLISFIRKIKELGFLVKLDTNGYCPEVLHQLLEEHLLDYVAMDIKNSPEKYTLTAGLYHLDLDKINRSIALLLACSIPYEFRTTLVSELHTTEDMIKIGQWIKGASAYFLQAYKESDSVISKGFTPCTYEQMKSFIGLLQPDILHIGIRGVDEC